MQRVKQEEADYADEKRRARDSDLEPGRLVLLKQRKEERQALNHVWRTSIYSYQEARERGYHIVTRNVRRNVADVEKYLREDTTRDEQVAEDDSSEEDNTGRITEPEGRPVRERRPPEYSKDYGVYKFC